MEAEKDKTMKMDVQHPNITLGTAGHIDHGKTALIKFLTGCDTDRLKEEKERGMSIDLGFAPCMISNMEVGIIDVPGHENFIKTMVAGANGMDGVIFVVAADDGIMAQTREHLDILTLLGVGHGIVALTKIDRVDPEHVEIVKLELEKFLTGTFLEGAPILPLSNTTGDGFDPFYMALMELVNSIKPKGLDGLFRLPVERTFSVKGYGTVVSGIPVSGSAKVGDEVELLPQGGRGRINGIQVYKRTSEIVAAGQCAALNVRHWDHSAISRGDIIAVPGYFSPHEWYACNLQMLQRSGFFLKNGSRVKFHTGTSELSARAYPMQGDRVQSGEKSIVQIRLDGPVVAGPGDHFIVRALSPLTTIGGGTIIEGVPKKLRRSRANVREDIEKRALAVKEEKSFVEYAIRTAESSAATDSELSFRTKIPLASIRRILDELVAEGKVIILGEKLCIHVDTKTRLEQRILEKLADFHAQSPESPGMTSQQLLDATKIARKVLDGMLEPLKNEGKIIEAKGRISHPEHQAKFSEEDQKLIDAIEPLFKERPFNPPSVDQVVEETRTPLKAVERIINLLVEHKRLVRVSDKQIFNSDAVERAREILTEHFGKEERLESVKFKYLLDTTRKYALPLLDYMDKIGVTRRVGNTRYSNK